jgi:Uma2 family endonuclease
MIAVMQDVLVRTRADFNRLPEEGLWEVVDGRAILLPANKVPHQKVSGALFLGLSRGLERLGYGYVFATVNVLIPPPEPQVSEVQSRVPDLVVSRHAPAENFEVGEPPELVIEILSTRRRNVERTEKLEDYARAGIPEYWIVNPFHRAVEVYLLRDGDYVLRETVSDGPLRPSAFSGLEIDLRSLWAVLD